MSFDYGVYFRQNFGVPALLTLFALALLIFSLILSFSRMKKSKNRLTSSDIFWLILLLLAFVHLMIPQIIKLSRGGFFLLFEREEDAVVIEGIIEERQELSWFTGYQYGCEQNEGNGEAIIVDGKQYYLMTYGNLQDGDFVSAKVLPNSRLILEIHALDPANQANP